MMRKDSPTMTKTIVFSTFLGCDIETLCRNHNGDPYVMLNLDYKRFSFDGNNKFPRNYVDCVEQNIGKVDVIFLSSHKAVRKELKERRIKHFLIYPSITLKDSWIVKMRKNGYNESLIKKIRDNFDQLIFNLQSENSPLVYKYQLTERTPSLTIDTIEYALSDDDLFITKFHNSKDYVGKVE